MRTEKLFNQNNSIVSFSCIYNERFCVYCELTSRSSHDLRMNKSPYIYKPEQLFR